MHGVEDIALEKQIEQALHFDVSSRLHDVGEYYFSKKLRQIEDLNKAGKNVINLGIGSPDLPPHPDVIETLRTESEKPNTHAYQNYKGNIILRQAIADWYRKWYAVEINAETEVLPLIGSKEGIMHICMTYVDADTLVLIPDPGYPTYKSAAQIAGATIKSYSLTKANNWFPDFAELKEIIAGHRTVNSQSRVIMFVNYPQMPTGKLPDKTLFENIVQFAIQHHILICHDNPYSFILNNEPMSMLSVPAAKQVVIELNSLSKSHNMAGWRVGMMIADKQRIDDVVRFKSNMDSGMFLPVQMAAAKALQIGENWFKELNNIYSKRREKVFDILDNLKCSYDKKQAGLFVWAAIPAVYKDGYALSDHILNDASVFITPGGIFGTAGDKYIRISLCSTVQKLDEALARISSINDQTS
ncbi:MAG: aminotransferase class I/II-fold pyridoxal phosphate-dependent enzyme [Ginsengibacter sp.]